MRKIVSLLTLMLFMSVVALAQGKISGTVRDQNGDPVPFATVNVKGTKVTVAADANARFIIAAKSGDVLEVSAVGLQKTEVTVSNSAEIGVTMTRSAATISDVVVTTALGIQRQAKSLGYSTAKVSGKEVVQAKPISVVNGLTGKVSGLQINTVNNGLFAPTRVTLRGNRSLTGNNQPLVVVDGAIYYSDLSTLNPEDISDVSILKGSSASAIYGSDASNGVILVTTKHGTHNRSSITFSSTVSFENVSYLPSLQNRFGGNGGEKFVYDFNDLSTNIPYENQSYGPEYRAGASVPIGRPLSDGTIQVVPFQSLTNEKRDFFNTGITTQNNLSYQAGDADNSFFLSVQDVSSKATMPGDHGRRDIFRVGGTRTYSIFSVNYSLAYTYKNTNTTNTGTVYQNVMNTPSYIPLTNYKNWQSDKYSTPDGYYNDYFDNPYWDIDNFRNITTENNVTGNFQFNVKPTSWLGFTYHAAINNISSRYEYKVGALHYSEFAKTNDTVLYSNYAGNGLDTTTESPKYAANGNENNAAYATSTFNNLLFTSDILANFNKSIDKDFTLNATLGTSYMDNKINYNGTGQGNGIGSVDLFFPVYNVSSFTGISVSALSQATAEARKLGFFGEAQLGYKDFAFVHGSYRADIDSRLSHDNRYIPYYDLDGALVLSTLFPSISEGNILNFAKLRYAHSVTGNASALAFGSAYIAYGAYATVPTFYSASGFPFNVGGYDINPTVANPNIKPEQVTEDEIGVSLGLFKDRMSLEGSVYKQRLTDGIVYAQTARSTGFQQALINAANTETKGVELDVKGTVLRTKDLSWNVGVNWTHNENKVISINGNLTSLGLTSANQYNGNPVGTNGNSFAVVGYSFPVIESRDWVRDSATGKVIVDPVTGLPSRSANLTILGQATPKDIVGITTSLTWKHFTFVATADYRGGYKIFNSIGQYMDFTGISSTTAATGRQQFVFPNSVVYDAAKGGYVDNTNIVTNDANFNFYPGLYRNVGANYVISAAAWKLREVAITYDFPQNWLSPTKFIKQVSLTASGRNLIMLRPSTNKWTDPEFNEDTGNDIGRTSENQSPPTRIFSATLSVTF
jgi:TonB-linked SusC/RagA family outer membrane protein